MNIPSELINAFHENRVVVFVGAGASIPAGLPNWDDLIIQLADEMKFPLPPLPLSQDLLLKIPQYYVNRSDSRRDLMRKLIRLLKEGREKILQAKPSLSRPVHYYLAQLPTHLFYTTNFDTFLEEELIEQSIEFDVIDTDNMARQFSERQRCQVRKLHGSIKGDWDDVVLTRSDYASLSQTRPIMFEALTEDLKANVFLFIGYSLRDPDFNSIYNNVFRAMQGKHQTHFMALLDNPGQYEMEDLRRRGILPISLWDFPGDDKTQQCIAFLSLLVEETSEQFQIRKFYQGINRGDQVYIVVTSRIHESEGYAFYPACDIHTASQIKDDLRKIGVMATVIPDVLALKDATNFLSDNIILVCAPYGNRFTGYFFEKASILTDKPVQLKFLESGNERYIELADGKRLYSDDPNNSPNPKRYDYALVARYQNPWMARKHIFVFGAMQAIGTHAIGEFIRKQGKYRQLTNIGGDGDIVAILPVAYLESEYDPFNYKFEIEELLFTVR